MARNASEWTLAIRKLIEDSQGGITHADARPLLQNLGFEVAVQPEAMSEGLSQFLEALAGYESPADEEVLVATGREIATSLGWSTQRLNQILSEYRIYKTFRAERSGFDVTKSTWCKLKGIGNQKVRKSRKPGRPLSSIKITAVPPPKHRGNVAPQVTSLRAGRKTVAVASDVKVVMAAVALVQEKGGIKAVEKEISAILAEAADLREQAVEKDNEALELQRQLALVDTLRKQLDKAA